MVKQYEVQDQFYLSKRAGDGVKAVAQKTACHRSHPATAYATTWYRKTWVFMFLLTIYLV